MCRLDDRAAVGLAFYTDTESVLFILFLLARRQNNNDTHSTFVTSILSGGAEKLPFINQKPKNKTIFRGGGAI